MRRAGRAYAALCLLFLYAPIASMIAMAFNASRYGALPPEWSFEWFVKLAGNEKLLNAAGNSLALAVATAAICVLLGVPFVLGATGFGKRARAATDALVLLPLTIPWLILGLSLLLLLRMLGMERNMFFVAAGHVVVSLPYAVLIISTRFAEMDGAVAEASASLGANGWTTFWRIQMPFLLPAVISGGFLAFLISFDNFIISYFLIPAGMTTLPMQIYSAIKFGFTPEINAISAILIALTAVVTVIVSLLARSSLKTLFKG